jgi:hypothetical protein
MGEEIVLRKKNRELCRQAAMVLEEEKPMTLRQLYYRLVSAGALDNKQAEYKRLGNLMTQLREYGDLPRSWIVDHVRSTLKPSSWSGLADFTDTVRQAYRKDFWASLDHHVEVFVEKDAVAGTLQPVTSEYDVALRVCRGYASVSFAGEIAELWAQVEKPIFAYYLGDYDPSGFDIERDLREKLERYSGRFDYALHADADGMLRSPDPDVSGGITWWKRLGVRARDFDLFGLVELPVKKKDTRASGFREQYGSRCAEVDAIPPNELRWRVETAIKAHIDQDRWQRLQRVEQLEQHTLKQMVAGWGGKLNLGQLSDEGADAR